MKTLLMSETSSSYLARPVLRFKKAISDGGMRRRRLKYCIFYILMAGIIFFFSASESTAQVSSSDDTAKTTSVYTADFMLKDLNGKEISLSIYKGKFVLLNFMTTWCPDCLTSIPRLKAIYKQYQEKGLVILNIDIQETQGKVAAYSKKHSLPYQTLLDEEGTFSKKIGVSGVPVKALIDRDGRIICWNCRSLENLLESNLK